jgi:beta-galactosidase beta subunit
MILDKLKNSKLYYSMNPNFKYAFEFLEKLDKNNLTAGQQLFRLDARR